MHSPNRFLKLALPLLFALGLGIMAPIGFALAEEDEPIEISADSKQTDFKAGVATYWGDVDIRQGELHAFGEQADLQLDNGQLVRAVLIGSPARFQNRDEQGELIKGQADIAEYEPAKNLLTLTGNARLDRAGDILRAPLITYNLRTEVANAGDPESGERVTTTIAPRNKPQP